MTHRLFPAWLALVGCTLLPLGATAQQPIPENACTPDIKAYCNNVEPGNGRILRCLQAHEGQLTARCQDTLDEANSKIAALRWTCGMDVLRLCPRTIGAGRPAMMGCLQRHQSELSGACQQGIRDLMGIEQSGAHHSPIGS